MSEWKDKISRSFGEHNLPEHIWEQICKIRSRPIEVVKDIIMGDYHKPHMVIPQGCRGYVLDHPDVFFLNSEEYEKVRTCPEGLLPVTILGYEDVLLVSSKDVKVIPPFFDLMLASFINREGDNNGTA